MAAKQDEDSDIVNYSFPSGINVRKFSGADFTLDSSVLIGIKFKDCIILLFYTQNEESIGLVRMWNRLASSVAGPIFASCNVLAEDEVAKAFASVKSDGNHPFHAYGLHQWPVIISYRGGFPQGVYNGLKSDQSIANWSLTMACNARYFEPIQVYGGIDLDGKGETIQSPVPYIDKAVKISSSDFDGNNEVRAKAGASSNEETTEEPTQEESTQGAQPVSPMASQ